MDDAQFKPGKYSVKVTDSRVVQSRRGYKYCVACCELLEIVHTDYEQMQVGKTYKVVFNIDNPVGYMFAGAFCLACKVPTNRLEYEDIIAIFETGEPHGHLLGAECEYVTTKLGYEILKIDWYTKGSPYRPTKVVFGDPS